jgi:tetratricopeptide (TPR) repeat protein
VLLRQTGSIAPGRVRDWLTPGFAGVMLVALGVAWAIPVSRAAWFANLGALSQTRAELAVYHWPEWGSQDELRRSGRIDLKPAIELYEQALAFDKTNATANRRMGQIEFALGEYDAACGNIQIAYKVAPYQRATRQFLGECYAITGQIDRAAELWRSIDLGQGQLTVRWASYASLNDKERAARIEQATRHVMK